MDAEWLFAAVLQCRRLDLYLQFDRPIEAHLLDQLRPLVARRGAREPLQYILGQTEFHGVTLRCDRRALIPRPETEELVELAIDLLKAANPEASRILDLGTGTGAIAIALAASLPKAEILAVDSSRQSLDLARDNTILNKLADRVVLRHSNWFSTIDGHYDLIVANPPYLTLSEWESAEPEVKQWEPRTALVAEDEGLADLERILDEAHGFLSPKGVVALETGIQHAKRLGEIAETRGYEWHKAQMDLSKRQRFFVAGRG